MKQIARNVTEKVLTPRGLVTVLFSSIGPVRFRGITPFEGNLYISRKCLTTDHLRPNWVAGFCIYKFLYVWLDLARPASHVMLVQP